MTTDPVADGAAAFLPSGPGPDPSRDPRWHPEALYIHLPFCEALCTYCDFAREVHSAPRARRYLAALERELAWKVGQLAAPPSTCPAPASLHRQAAGAGTRSGGGGPAFAPRTIFLGGGTPSAFSVSELRLFFEAFERWVDRSRVEEFTVEANPSSVDREKLELLRRHGVNRISFGVQSFQPHLLQVLGRVHGARQGREAVGWARAAGFENISLDLMHGLPGQRLEDLERDLAEILALDVEHLSAYGLLHEAGTPLTLALERGQLTKPTEEEEAERYRLVMERMEAGGLAQYEISNYAKPGREARHNLVYWHGEAYLGVGVSAAEYVWGWRSVNLRSMEAYLEAVERGVGSALESEECLPAAARVGEALMLALRLREGLDPGAFGRRWGLDLEAAHARTLEHFRSLGLMEQTSCGRWRISRAGLPVADAILREFLA